MLVETLSDSQLAMLNRSHFVIYPINHMLTGEQNNLQISPHYTSKPHSSSSILDTFSVKPDKNNWISSPLILIEKVNSFLTTIINQWDFSYEFAQTSYWKGKFLTGDKLCEVIINLYFNQKLEIVVEIKRTRGDNAPYITLFKEFKANLPSYIYSSPLVIHSMPSSSSIVHQPISSSSKSLPPIVSKETFLKFVEPCFKLSSEPFLNSQIQSAYMINDISKNHAQLLIDPIFIQQCIKTLEILITQTEFDDVKQHTIIALQNFIIMNEYKWAILHSDSLMTTIFTIGKAFIMDSESEVKRSHDRVDPSMRYPQRPPYQTAKITRICHNVLKELESYDSGLFHHRLIQLNLISMDSINSPSVENKGFISPLKNPGQQQDKGVSLSSHITWSQDKQELLDKMGSITSMSSSSHQESSDQITPSRSEVVGEKKDHPRPKRANLTKGISIAESETESHLHDLYELRCDVLGPNHINTLGTLEDLAVLQARRGNVRDAERSYELLLHGMMETTEGVHGLKTQQIAKAYLRLLKHNGKDIRSKIAELMNNGLKGIDFEDVVTTHESNASPRHQGSFFSLLSGGEGDDD